MSGDSIRKQIFWCPFCMQLAQVENRSRFSNIFITLKEFGGRNRSVRLEARVGDGRVGAAEDLWGEHTDYGGDHTNLYMLQNRTESHTHTHTTWVPVRIQQSEYSVFSQCHCPGFDIALHVCKMLLVGETGWRVPRASWYIFSFFCSVLWILSK